MKSSTHLKKMVLSWLTIVTGEQFTTICLFVSISLSLGAALDTILNGTLRVLVVLHYNTILTIERCGLKILSIVLRTSTLVRWKSSFLSPNKISVAVKRMENLSNTHSMILSTLWLFLLFMCLSLILKQHQNCLLSMTTPSRRVLLSNKLKRYLWDSKCHKVIYTLFLALQ